MYNNSIHSLTGKRVRIIADDVAYTGLLIEVTETSVELQGDIQWLSIPVDRISSIAEEDPEISSG